MATWQIEWENNDKTVIWGVIPLSLKPQDKPTRQIVDTYGKYMLLDMVSPYTSLGVTK